MKREFKIIDAEPHFLEPHDLWERNLPEPFRSKTTVRSLDQRKTNFLGVGENLLNHDAMVSVAMASCLRPHDRAPWRKR